MTGKPYDRTRLSSKIMTVKECADYLKVHPSTIYKLLSQHKLPAFKVGADWRLSIEAVDAWRLNQKT